MPHSPRASSVMGGYPGLLGFEGAFKGQRQEKAGRMELRPLFTAGTVTGGEGRGSGPCR